MRNHPDSAAFHLLLLFILTVLGAGIRHLESPPAVAPGILPGGEPLLLDAGGSSLTLKQALPPDGSGILLLMRPHDPIPARSAAMRAWKKLQSEKCLPVRAVWITGRREGITNRAAWLGIPVPLLMRPDTFHRRLRIPGLPSLLRLRSGRVESCRVITAGGTGG